MTVTISTCDHKTYLPFTRDDAETLRIYGVQHATNWTKAQYIAYANANGFTIKVW
jgi:hypothetical protein